jgi:hypothetical protein
MKLMREMLEREETGIIVGQPLVAWFNSHQPNTDVRVANLMEVISDIRCPITVVEEMKSKEQIHAINVKVGLSFNCYNNECSLFTPSFVSHALVRCGCTIMLASHFSACALVLAVHM